MTLDTAVPHNLRTSQLHPTFAVGRAGRHLIATIALLCFLSEGPRQANAAETQPTLTPDPAGLETDGLPAGVQLDELEPAPQATMVSRWWFWTAAGAVAVATAAVIIASSRGSAPPITNLGNQVFAP